MRDGTRDDIVATAVHPLAKSLPEVSVSDSRIPPIDTAAVHAGECRPNPLRTIPPPLALASTFHFANLDEAVAVVEGQQAMAYYSRYGNPTVRAAEKKLAALDGADDALLFASGMSAFATTMMALVSAGQHVVFSEDCYRPSRQFLQGTLARFGVESTAVPVGDLEAIEAAIRPRETKVLFVESPSNPFNRVADVAALAALKRRHRGVKLVVDATFATPLNLRPLEHGADLVIHSATKYLGGHNDVLAGVVAGRAGMIEAIGELRSQMGPSPDAHAAWLVLRGLKSFPARMRRHNANALAVAEALEADPRVTRVWYAGLPSHPDHERAAASMAGFGGVVAFEHGAGFEGTRRFCDAVEVFQIAASLGGAESMLHPPAVFSWWDLPEAARAAAGISDGLVRLAVGIEDADDLVADVRRGLDALAG